MNVHLASGPILPAPRPAVLLGGLCLTLAAWGQAGSDVPPSRTAPEVLRPRAAPQPFGIDLPASVPASLPEGADQLFVTLAWAELSGAHPSLGSAQRELLGGLVNRRVSVAQLFEIATALEAGFARAGYPLVRVLLPPQRLEDGGGVRFQAIDGFIESITTEGVPERVRQAVLARTAALIGRRPLTLAELESRLASADDIPGLRLRSTLTRGDAAGSTRLVLDGTHQPLAVSVSGDNRLDSALGRWQWSLAVSGNGLFGVEDQVFALVKQSAGPGSSGAQGTGLRLIGAGVALPLDRQGASAGLEFTASTTRPAITPGLPATRGEFTRSAARLSWPLEGDRTRRLTAGLVLEQIEQRSTAVDFGLDLKRDRYRVAKLSLDRVGPAEPWGWLALGGSLVRGLGGRDAAQAAAEGVPLSRQAAGPRFTRAQASLRWLVPVAATGSRVALHAGAQTSFGRALLQSEQFVLDGPSAASGFLPGSVAVDSGATLRAEWTQPFRVDLAGTSAALAPYLFVADGRGRLAAPTALEAPSITARSQGVGLRADWSPRPGQPISVEIEWARGSGLADDARRPRRAWASLRSGF